MPLSIAVNHPELILESGKHIGFAYTIASNRIGHRCGYICVPFGHPWHGITVNDGRKLQSYGLDVHGGIGFAEADVGIDKAEKNNGWWLGFDCAQPDDGIDLSLVEDEELRKIYANFPQRRKRIIKTIEYVRNQCFSLIEQAISAANQKQ